VASKVDDLPVCDYSRLLVGKITEGQRGTEVRAERNRSWRHLKPEIDRARRIAFVMRNHEIAQLSGIDDRLNMLVHASERSAQASVEKYRLVSGDHEEIDCDPGQ
jgi:hypothetical protein